jgi:hypothetical protein
MLRPCPYCGVELEMADSATGWIQCGACQKDFNLDGPIRVSPIERALYPVICPNCNAPKSADSPTCPSCGFTYHKGAQGPRTRFDWARFCRFIVAVSIPLFLVAYFYVGLGMPGNFFSLGGGLLFLGLILILYGLSAIPPAKDWGGEFPFFPDFLGEGNAAIFSVLDLVILLLGMLCIGAVFHFRVQ